MSSPMDPLMYILFAHAYAFLSILIVSSLLQKLLADVASINTLLVHNLIKNLICPLMGTGKVQLLTME